MSEKLNRIQSNAKIVHTAMKGYYDAWCELESLANKEGLTLDTKTAELKEL